MDEKSKLYVFEKKEVALLLLFMVLIASTSFVLGVRVGKNYSFETAGYTNQDQKMVDMLSQNEEEMKKIEASKDDKDKATDPAVLQVETHEKLKQKIIDELAQEEDRVKEAGGVNPITDPSSGSVAGIPEDTFEIISPGQGKVKKASDKLVGKFTIQLGSFPSLEEAEEFSNGFIVRGYSPYIRESKLSNGTWYRVSLGAFGSISDVKEYIVKEKTLFIDQDYLIVRFE